jgi:acyl carrier protein
MSAPGGKQSAEDRLRRLICDTFGHAPEKITADTRFAADLGADSLDMIELGMNCEDEFGFELSDDEIAKAETFGDALTTITEKLAAGGR